MNHLITVEGRSPSDIVIGGDSAGGNLTLALISHILHPHPKVPTKVELKEPFLGAVLISPWVSFDIDQGSFHKNLRTDILCQEVGKRWSEAFRGNSDLDIYNQPIKADKEWFGKLDTVIRNLLIWGGGGEVLITSIDAFAKQMKEIFPRTEYIKEVSYNYVCSMGVVEN